MNFLFELTREYLTNYEGSDTFRAKIYYEISASKGIMNAHVDIPFGAIIYIKDNLKLAEDIWKAILKYAEAVLEEDKEFIN